MPTITQYMSSLALASAVVLSAACQECPTDLSPKVASGPAETPSAGAPAGEKERDLAMAPIFESWKLHPDDAGKNVNKDKLTKALVMPCDFPGRGGMALYNCFGAEDADTVNIALDLASYDVWRVLQVLEKVEAAKTFEARDALWRTYFTGEHESLDPEGHTSLQNWFGSYSAARFNKISYAYKKVWELYLGPGWKEKRVSCSCRAKAMSAHAANPHGIEVCPKFFEKDLYDQARVFVHEFMHDVKGEPGGNIQDTHKECFYDDGDDGLQKCYSTEESLMLAEKYPDLANSNPQNYALYSTRLMQSYHAGKCTNPAVCSARDTDVVKCQPAALPPKPQYPECTGGPGDPGCACADVDIVAAEHAATDGGYPDGAGSYLANKTPGGQFCYEPGTVCGKQMFKGQEIPICKKCEDNPEVGCPCTTEEACGGELTCWGGSNAGFGSSRPGTCLPKDALTLQKLPWFCLDNCAAINSYGEQGAACVYQQVPGLEFSHGTCVNFATSCGEDLAGQCELSGKTCRVDGANNDVCAAECKTKVDCVNHGFPGTYECDAEGNLGVENGHCVAPGCGSSNSDFCKLFR